MKLTVKSTAGLKLETGKAEQIIFDDDLPGFGIRLREGGSRSWVFQHKLGAKQRRLSFGSVSAIGIADARERAAQLHAQVKLGQDPAGEKAVAKKQATETFRAVADEFLAEKRATLRERSFPDIERHLLKHAKALHELQLAKISRRDIAGVISSVAKNSGEVTANRVRTSLTTFFGWTIGAGRLEDNPVTHTNRYEEHSRDRVLSPAELRTIWNALEGDHYGAIIKLLMLTAQRGGEIAGLRRSECLGDAIELPGERTKNHRPHAVPLSGPAKAIIEEQPERTGPDGKPRELLFGIGDGPFSGWSNSKERIEARIKEQTGKTLPHWTPHDLRRSAATHMAEKLAHSP